MSFLKTFARSDSISYNDNCYIKSAPEVKAAVRAPIHEKLLELPPWQLL